MNIIYFYSEVMGYTLSVVKELVKDKQTQVHIVYWDKNRKAKFELPPIENVIYYKRSEMQVDDLKNMLVNLKPGILYVSGRMDKDYLKATKFAKKLNIKTVSAFDNQWHGSLKNYIATSISYLLYRQYFDYLWVAGVYQYEYARRLRYSKDKIIWNLYSAENSIFNNNYQNKKLPANKTFLFVGRLVKEKGISLLIQAFIESQKELHHDWKLLLIGNGPVKDEIPENASIEIVDFLQPEELIRKTSDGGVFILPSIHEPWGVVLHEFALLGFPIICSDACGAATAFVKNGYNGYIFEANNMNDLKACLVKIIHTDNSELAQMSVRSHELGNYINPTISAVTLMSVLK